MLERDYSWLKTNKIALKHGMRYTRFYNIWAKMKDRCVHKRRGYKKINICFKWKKFENFRDDMYESYQKHCEEFGEKQTTIDRVNNNGNYKLKNCRWATYSEQNFNRRYC